MQFAVMFMLALAQGQFGKDTKGADPTTHDKPAVAQPDSRADTPSATSSNTSDRAEPLSPTHQTELQGNAPKKTPAKSAKKGHKSTMPEATKPSTPGGNGSERQEGASEKKAPKHKEPNMQNEDKKDTKEH
jgi:hypothetical protein